MPDHVLRIERQDKIAILTLNRPDRLNALSPDLRQELEQACQDIRHDDDIWAAVLTGEGRGFCSGVDLRAAPPATDDIGSRQERLDVYGWTGRQAMAVYRTLDKPIVAAVNGVAAGAGMSLALACDLRVGSPLTRFKTVFLERSLSPDSGMSFFLPRIVGIQPRLRPDLHQPLRGSRGSASYRPARPPGACREPSGRGPGGGTADRLLAAGGHANRPPRPAAEHGGRPGNATAPRVLRADPGAPRAA